MKQCFNFLPFILFVIFCSCKNRQQQLDNYSVKIDSLIQTKKPRSFNGVILITKKGETKYSKTYGYSNFENKTPITINDNFRIQSNSKQVTAVLILKEFEKGKIDLKSSIREYLPNMEKSWADTVNVHQLLNMSSGILNIDQPLIFEPGSDYKYSNPAYGLLGRIIENITGEKYTEIANSMFKDLKMSNTFCYELGENQNNLINGYTISNNEYKLVDFYARGITEEGWKHFIPAGGIISNVYDLNTWDIKLHNGQILKPESYELMVNYNITGQHDAFGSEKIGYGYGVRIDDDKSIKLVGHAGRGLGFVSIKFYIPEKDVNVIMLENVYSEDVSIIYHFEKEIKEIVLNSSIMK